MKKVLYIILVLGFSLTIISCAEKEESTTTATAAITSSDDTSDESSDNSSSAVVTMASLTIGSQTYTNAFQTVADGCQDTEMTDNSNGDKIYHLTTMVYYDNKSLAYSAPFYKDSSCTNKYLETSVLTNEEGTFPIPFYHNTIGDNITVVQLSNYYDNGTAISVFDNSSNAVDNGSMYGLICNRDNSTSPFKMCMQIYPKSDSEVHFGGGGNFYSCSQNSNDACTSPDNFTHIQLPSGSSSLTLKKYNVMK